MTSAEYKARRKEDHERERHAVMAIIERVTSTFERNDMLRAISFLSKENERLERENEHHRYNHSMHKRDTRRLSWLALHDGAICFGPSYEYYVLFRAPYFMPGMVMEGPRHRHDWRAAIDDAEMILEKVLNKHIAEAKKNL